MSSTVQERQSQLNVRLAHLTPSATIGLIGRISQLRAEGISVISFAAGEPDFPTPAPIKAAAIEALERNQTRYTPAGGIPELRKAVAQRVTQDSGIAFAPDQVTITCGAKEALFLAFQTICNEGDEVIVPAPYWVSYIEQVRLVGAEPVIVDTNETTDFKMTPQQLAAHLTPRTRAIVLCSPSNPTGVVYNAHELQGLAEVLRKHHAMPERAYDTMVVTDEIYDTIYYGAEAYTRWLHVAPDFTGQTLVVNGASKTFAMTGWRLGYIAGPKEIIGAIKMIQSHSTTHPASLAQYAALAAFTPSYELNATVAQMVQAFRERRDLILELLTKISGVQCNVPEGTFYVFPNVSALLNRPLVGGSVCATSRELAAYLLDQAHIGVVPGEAFGATGYLRLSYAQSNDSIVEGMQRFTEAVV